MYFDNLKSERKNEVKARLTDTSARSLAAVINAAIQSEAIDLTLSAHRHAAAATLDAPRHTKTQSRVSRDRLGPSTSADPSPSKGKDKGKGKGKRTSSETPEAATKHAKANPSAPDRAAHKGTDGLMYPNRAFTEKHHGDFAKYEAKCKICTNFHERTGTGGKAKVPKDQYHTTAQCPAYIACNAVSPTSASACLLHGVTVRHMSTMAEVHSTGTMRTIAGPNGRLRAISLRICVAFSSVRALAPQIWPTEAISVDKSYVWAHSIVV